MTGTSDFNEVFFDDVQVPASAMIGELNNGWHIATTSLASERAGVGALVIRLRQNLDALIAYAKVDAVERRHHRRRPDHPPAARRRARPRRGRDARVRRRDGPPAAVASFREADVPLTKLGFAVLNEQLSYLGIEIQGMRGTLATDDPEAARRRPLAGRVPLRQGLHDLRRQQPDHAEPARRACPRPPREPKPA